MVTFLYFFIEAKLPKLSNAKNSESISTKSNLNKYTTKEANNENKV